jgi:ornithine cyclodeaminase
MDGSPAADSEGLVVLDRAAINAVLSIEACIVITEAALRKTSDGTATQDVRRTLPLPGGDGSCLSLMYAAIGARPLFGAKVLSVLPSNFEHGLPSHRGLILLFEKEHGRPVALINGGELTAWRTAAASAVATRLLSRKDSRTLAILGYGEQARRHILTISKVRPIEEVRVWGRDFAKAEAFAAHPELANMNIVPTKTPSDAVQGADVICTTTSSVTPVLFGVWLEPGQHVNCVGASVPSCREIDDEVVLRARIWGDYLPMTWTSAGELVEALAKGLITTDHVQGEIGSVISGAMAGRLNATDITLYRSLGVPAQDIELANFVYEAARERGLGLSIPMEA